MRRIAQGATILIAPLASGAVRERDFAHAQIEGHVAQSGGPAQQSGRTRRS